MQESFYREGSFDDAHSFCALHDSVLDLVQQVALCSRSCSTNAFIINTLTYCPFPPNLQNTIHPKPLELKGPKIFKQCSPPVMRDVSLVTGQVSCFGHICGANW